MSLENSLARTEHVSKEYVPPAEENLPSLRIPNPNTSIQTSCGYSRPIKSNSIDLREMPSKSSYTSPFRNAPNSRCSIITSRNYNITLDFQTSDTRLMSNQHIFTKSGVNVPNPQSCIPGPRNSCGRIGHFQAADSRCVTAKCMDWFPGSD